MTTLPQTRRAYRDPDDRFLGGVAGGLASHLGLSALSIRVAFLVLTLLGGFGAVWYCGLWLMMPVRDPIQAEADAPPGLGAATRGGFRTVSPRRHRRDAAIVVSLLVTFVGVLALLQGVGSGLSQPVVWPVLVGGGGVVLLWWQTDQTSRSAWLTTGSSWKTWVRTVAGLALLVAAVLLAVLQSGVRGALVTALASIVIALLGAALVLGPWLLRTTRELRYERSERVRSQERADVAAHLHDSVLQTLALIQRQANDAPAVVRLARTQERELRRWLFEPANQSVLTLSTALRNAADEVEDAHEVTVEVVMVGDAPVEDSYQPLVAATREAISNAARHAHTPRVDVYAEVGATGAEIFVRDRGTGFDPERIPADRLGVRGSIIGRMVRHGGTADVRSHPGEGTEIRLWMPAADAGQRSAT